MGAPLRFIDEAFGTVFELQGASMPAPPIRFGRRPRRVVTDYGGRNQKSAQVLGEEYPPIELSGEWGDKDLGQGEAQRLRGELEALVAAGSLIQLEYGSNQRWGFLDVEFEERRDDWVNWTATLEVLYVEPPEASPQPIFDAPPNDLGTLAEIKLDDLDTLASNPPFSLVPSVLTDLTLALLSAQNKLGAGLKPLRDIETFAELTADIARIAASTILDSGRSVRSVRDTFESILADDASLTGGVDAEEVAVWRDETITAANLAIAEIIALARKLLDAVEPPTGRTHIVSAGETIQGIAERYYDDRSKWILIADANDLDFTNLTPGQSLRIPPET